MKISVNLHLFAVEDSIRRGWTSVDRGPTLVHHSCNSLANSATEPYTLGPIPRFFLRSLLQILPDFVRVSLYRLINKQVGFWDPKQKNSRVKILPFDLILKKGRAHTANEANALLMIEKHSSINAPRLIDSVMVDETWGFIFMTRIFGDRLDRVDYRITHEECDQIGKDLGQ